MRPAPRRWVRGAFSFLPALFSLAWLVVTAAPVAAHDLWILPGTFELSVGEVSRVFLNSGDVFPESLTLTNKARLADVAIVDGAGPRPLSGFRVEGKSLTFDLPADSVGTLAVGVELHTRQVRLRASDFEDYLSLERLSAAAALREAKEETEEAAFERYTKWAKTLVKVVEPGGEAASSDREGWRKPIGHRLEIVPLVDPGALTAGDSFELELVFEGEPVSGVPLVAGHTGGESRAVESETDASGRGVIPLPEPGRWYVRALHLKRVEDDPQVKWESFWCTLTFQVEPRTP